MDQGYIENRWKISRSEKVNSRVTGRLPRERRHSGNRKNPPRHPQMGQVWKNERIWRDQPYVFKRPIPIGLYGRGESSEHCKAVIETCDLSNKDKDKYIKTDLVIISLIRVVNIFHNIFLCELSHRQLFIDSVPSQCFELKWHSRSGSRVCHASSRCPHLDSVASHSDSEPPPVPPPPPECRLIFQHCKYQGRGQSVLVGIWASLWINHPDQLTCCRWGGSPLYEPESDGAAGETFRENQAGVWSGGCLFLAALVFLESVTVA